MSKNFHPLFLKKKNPGKFGKSALIFDSFIYIFSLFFPSLLFIPLYIFFCSNFSQINLSNAFNVEKSIHRDT